jgi:cytochrome c peroxidase
MRLLFFILTTSALSAALPPDHAQRMARGLKLFDNEVSALLKQNCLKCHGGEKVKSDFDMATREDLLRGGSHGSVVVPFDAKGSLVGVSDPSCQRAEHARQQPEAACGVHFENSRLDR